MASIRHRLYERAVQSPDHDVRFLERVFRQRAKREPRSLREDFCGTAQLCRAWVESDDDRVATGVDLDPEVLAFASSARGELLDEEAERMHLVRRDVRERSELTFDLIAAMNFSWALFEDAMLLEYLSSSREGLEDDGLMVMELFGGEGMRRPARVAHRHDGFTYVWEQRSFDGRVLDARIHFHLDDGRALHDAFAYSFVVRTIPELEALLARAGFGSRDLFVEDRRGRYVRRQGRPRGPLFRAMLVAGR